MAQYIQQLSGSHMLPFINCKTGNSFERKINKFEAISSSNILTISQILYQRIFVAALTYDLKCNIMATKRAVFIKSQISVKLVLLVLRTKC
jgi:TRAP-type mannitol/chloroaromatic compound transport system permease small subunit